MPTGDPLVDARAEIERARQRDRVLLQYRAAVTALRRGDRVTATALLDDALTTANNLFGPNRDARRARGYFSPEAKKTFVGEPYERVMANFYRGILYWMDGELDNARACFRNGQFEDSDAENKTYSQDYVLLDYLDGYATTKLAGNALDRLKSARANSKIYSPPDYDPAANVVVFAEFGMGPRKYSSGQYGEELRFRPGSSTIRALRVKAANQTVLAPAYDELSYQATTRGGRVMDHILGNKAVFKATTDTLGDVALVSGLVVSQTKGNEEVGLGLALFGLANKIVSAATQPKADTRCWENLPQYLAFAALRLPPGPHTVTLEFLDASNNVLAAETKTLSIQVAPPPRDTVLFISNQKP